jgi:hypothetical protein
MFYREAVGVIRPLRLRENRLANRLGRDVVDRLRRGFANFGGVGLARHGFFSKGFDQMVE